MRRMAIVLLVSGCAPGSDAIHLVIDSKSTVSGIADYSITEKNGSDSAHLDVHASPADTIPPPKSIALTFDRMREGAIVFTVDALDAMGRQLATGMGTGNIEHGRETSTTVVLGGGNPDGGVDLGCGDTTSDPMNCGMCGKACTLSHATAGCAMSNCTVASCAMGFGDCDKIAATGCEVDTTSDAKNCSGCGLPCAMGQTCSASKCMDRVLVVGTDLDMAQKGLKDVQAKLMATGSFAQIDVFDAGAGTPTLAQLQTYAAVLVYADPGKMFADSKALGDNLGAYFDGGGRVVTAALANSITWPLQGNFVIKGYMLFATNGSQMAPANDSINIPMINKNHPLVAGVQGFTATAYQSTSGTANGGKAVAAWTNSLSPLVVTGAINARNRVDLNFFPPSHDVNVNYWTGDGDKLMRNALIYQ